MSLETKVPGRKGKKNAGRAVADCWLGSARRWGGGRDTGRSRTMMSRVGCRMMRWRREGDEGRGGGKCGGSDGSCKREEKTVVIPHTHGSIPLSHASRQTRD